MVYKRILAAALAISMAVSMLSACGSADSTVSSADSTVSADSKDNDSSEVEPVEGAVVLTAENVKLVGRTYLSDNILWLALSGAGAEFTYTGKKLDITIVGDGTISGSADNQARVAVYVDGERTDEKMIDAEEVVLSAFESDEEKTVTVKIVKLSECAMSCCGIKPIEIADGESIAPAPARAHTIEFIGDSITCGYGVDDEVKEHPFSTTTEDVTKAYAYKTAQLLDADYSMFSVSGYGIISGYTTGDTPVSAQTVPQYYGSLGFSYSSFDGTSPQSLDWDFESFKPEVIVINLGTNDASYTGGKSDRQEEYKLAYIEFIKQVREKNPDAEIFCTLGIMGATLVKPLAMAVKEYCEETGDDKIHAFQFDTQDGDADGYAADWHPTEATHEKASAKLAEEIKSVMGW